MKNWRTTLSGIAMLLMSVTNVVNNPKVIGDPQTITAIIGGIGLIAAKDGNVTGGTVKQ